MKKCFIAALISVLSMLAAKPLVAQIDLNNLDLNDIIGKVMQVKRGFAPKFALGKVSIPQISKVAEILGLKKNAQVNKLFNTFRTGRTVYKVAAYAGGALALFGVAKKIGNSVHSSGYKAAIASGVATISSGLAVKFLTKAASYKAVDIFNGIAAKKIKDIFSLRPASSVAGIGLYVKL